MVNIDSINRAVTMLTTLCPLFGLVKRDSTFRVLDSNAAGSNRSPMSCSSLSSKEFGSINQAIATLTTPQ
jgi:hypothetical protein